MVGKESVAATHRLRMNPPTDYNAPTPPRSGLLEQNVGPKARSKALKNGRFGWPGLGQRRRSSLNGVHHEVVS